MNKEKETVKRKRAPRKTNQPAPEPVEVKKEKKPDNAVEGTVYSGPNQQGF